MLPKPIRATAAEIVRLFHYDPNTGILYNRVDRGRAKAGEEAGSIRLGRRKVVRVNGQHVYVYRVTWLYCYGYLPLVDVDHADNDEGNNRFGNLRLCIDGGVNSHNQIKARIGSKSGMLGVSVRTDPSKKKKFHAVIQAGYESYSLGYYYTPERANEAYVQAKRKLHKFGML